MNIYLSLTVYIGPEKPQWGVANYVYMHTAYTHRDKRNFTIDQFRYIKIQPNTIDRGRRGGLMVSELVSADRAVQVRALAGDIVLCFWARHFTLTVPLSTHMYKWVLANLIVVVTLRLSSIPSGKDWGRNTPTTVSSYRNRDKLRRDGPLGLHADFTF